mgnify:CR=1 FL=1
MDNQQIPNMNPQQENGIDIAGIINALWKHRLLFVKVLGIAFVVGCIYAFSKPKYYTCEVMLAPELSSNRSSTSLSSLARSFGMRLGNTTMNSSEALYPTLYPDLMNSVDFKTSLFHIMVRQEDSLTTKTYYDYLLNDQKRPWWSAAIGSVTGAIASLFAREDTTEMKKEVNPFRLTKQQTAIAKVIDHKVVCDVDQKTMVITIDVTDQDPLVCATVADSVKERLQDFITEYRTNKSRVDLEYSKKLCAESKQRYEKARKLYADFVDSNQDLLLQSVRIKQTDLENEMQLQYNAYVSYAAQLQNAEAKVQEETPAFTTLQSATVPLKAAGPSKKKILLVFLFLAFFGTSVWVLHKENQLKPLLGLN